MPESLKEVPRIVTRVRKSESQSNREFAFTETDVNLPGLSPSIHSFRQKAWEIYRSISIPTTLEEAWRRTDIRKLAADRFQLANNNMQGKLAPVPDWLLRPLADDVHGGELILRANAVNSKLDPALTQQGVVFTDLQTAFSQHPQLVEKILGKTVRAEDGKFAAMTAALSQTGVLLYVPKGVQVSTPLHSLLWGPGLDLAYISHIMVYLEEGATVTYVHEFASPTEAGGQTLHSGIVEIYVGPRANLRFVELQSWGEHVWNFTHERAQVDQDGVLDWVFGAMGSHLTKNFSEIDLVGEGSSGKMSGFYFCEHDQHLDHDTQQNHFAPHTSSDLLFKGALIHESRSVWQGMIYVAPGAQRIDGYQANRNLVLSRKARADSIPGLEILADDVRCSHGATVGKIDEDQVFYMMARGIPRRLAERAIVEGFFDPIMQRIPFDGVRQRFQEAISRKMEIFEETQS